VSEENKDFTVDQFAAGVRYKLGENSGLDATIKFVFDCGSVVFVDGKSVPNSVTQHDNESDVTLRLSIETVNLLYRKELNPMVAVMSGKIKIEGNAMAAMKLGQIFG
jgi:putative sterol carrier protein